MPIYEYRCGDCHKRVSVFFRSFSAVDEEEARCPNCNGTHLKRLMSRVRVIRHGALAKSDGDFDDSMLDNLDENDPRSMGRLMRQMADESGEDLGPEFSEVVNRLEKGEDPEAIEKSMPELADMMGGDEAAGGAGLGGMSGLDDDI
jgi:putative FmdB family regulatory protein